MVPLLSSLGIAKVCDNIHTCDGNNDNAFKYTNSIYIKML